MFDKLKLRLISINMALLTTVFIVIFSAYRKRRRDRKDVSVSINQVNNTNIC